VRERYETPRLSAKPGICRRRSGFPRGKADVEAGALGGAVAQGGDSGGEGARPEGEGVEEGVGLGIAGGGVEEF